MALSRYFRSLYQVALAREPEGAAIRNTTASFIVRVAGAFAAFLLNISLARFAGVKDYGIFVFVMAWVSVLLVPGCLGFDKLLVREVALRIGEGASDLAQVDIRLTTRMGAVAGILLGAALTTAALMTDVQPRVLRDALMIAGLLIPILSVVRIRQAALQGMSAAASGQIPELLVQPLSLAALAGGFVLVSKNHVPAPILVLTAVVAGLLALLAAGTLLRRRSAGAENVSGAGWQQAACHLLHMGLPLLAVGGVYVLNDQIAALLLGTLADATQVAIYNAAEKWSGLLVFMLQVAGPALAPLFASLYASNDIHRLQWIFTRSTQAGMLAGLVGLVVIFAAPRALLGTFGAGFQAGRAPLLILAVGQFWNAATGLVGIVLIMTGHDGRVVWSTAAGMVFNSVLGILLIPRWASVGAAVAMSGGVVLSNSLLGYFVYRDLRIFPGALGLLWASRGRRL